MNSFSDIIQAGKDVNEVRKQCCYYDKDFGIYFKCDKTPLEDLVQESIFTDI